MCPVAQRTRILVPLSWLIAGNAAAQLAPGYVDPEPVLRAAATAIGADKLKCVTISGTGYAGAVGQQRESAWNVDWPRGESLANYTRTMNWEGKWSKGGVERVCGIDGLALTPGGLEGCPAKSSQAAEIETVVLQAHQNGNICLISSGDGRRPYSQTSNACAYRTFRPRSAP